MVPVVRLHTRMQRIVLIRAYIDLPWSQRFLFLFFPMKEPRSGEKEKPLVTLDLNLTFMQRPAVKRVKFIITKRTNGKSAITCLSAANFLKRGRPGKLLL